MKCNKEIIYNLYYNTYYICNQNTILLYIYIMLIQNIAFNA